MELNKGDSKFSRPTPVMENSAAESEMDRCYLQLIQLIHLLGSAFVAPHFWKRGQAVDDTFDQMGKILTNLASVCGHTDDILICETEHSETYSKNNVARYTIQFGNYTLNTEKAAKVANRSKTSATQLLRKLQIAFDIFSVNGIQDLYIHLSNDLDRNLENLQISLEIISLFDQTVKSGLKTIFQEKDQQVNFPVIIGEQGKADCNLTILAALNHLSKNTMGTINDLVKEYIKDHLFSSDPNGEYKTFNILSNLKGLSEKLILPPLEANNLAFRLSLPESSTVSSAEESLTNNIAMIIERDRPEKFLSISDQPIVSSAVSDQTMQKIDHLESIDSIAHQRDHSQIIDLVAPVEKKTNKVSNLKEVEDSVTHGMSVETDNGKEQFSEVSVTDKDNIDNTCTSFIHRVEEATHLLSSLENTENGEKILDGIIESLQRCLGKMQNENGEDILIEDRSSLGVVENFHYRIVNMLPVSGKHGERKNVTAVSDRTNFDIQKADHDRIAEKFGFSSSDIQNISNLLGGCFDSKGNFIRTEFELRIPQFITFDKNIFEFLWGYLNEPLQRNDRVAFLNSLYLLAYKMEQSQKILSFLLDEILKKPLKISYSDRNAFILASLLLRKYNKEFSIDIELTPGEVLLVKNGLDEDILQFASVRIESNHQLIKDKLEIIHQRLVKALNENNPKSASWDPHFLLSLQREAFIFISLVSGRSPRQLINAALTKYGNPGSELYRHHSRDEFISFLLQQLKLLIRGFGRVGDIEDLGILTDLKKNEHQFVEMLSNSLHKKNVAQVFKMIDQAMGNITSLQ